jgi:hypothetical protein
MRILFKTRDYSNILRADIFDLLQVDTLSHNVIGGPRAAQFSAPAHLDSAWDYVRLLGCPVEVVGEDILRPIWWGRVNSITVPHGLMTFGVTLDGMANVVAVSYAQVNVGTAVPADQILTDWAINQLSVDLYGGYMLIVNKSQSEAAAAVAARDVYLREYGYPLQANDLAWVLGHAWNSVLPKSSHHVSSHDHPTGDHAGNRAIYHGRGYQERQRD